LYHSAECGYNVDEKNIEFVNHYYIAVGTSAAIQYMFYVEVDESLKVEGSGGGLEAENEMIELVKVPLAQVKQFINDNSKVKTPALLFALQWWRAEKQ